MTEPTDATAGPYQLVDELAARPDQIRAALGVDDGGGAPVTHAITVGQPYAWAIAAGHKLIENRGHGATYRGPLAIHAARQWSRAGQSEVPRILGRTWYDVAGLVGSGRNFGSIIAVAELVDCHVAAGGCCGPWGWPEHSGRPTPRHLVLADVRPLSEPVPCRGWLGLWPLPGDVAEMVTRRAGVVS